MKIRKRTGDIVDFNKDKIIEAIKGANNAIKQKERISIKEIKEVADTIVRVVSSEDRLLTVEHIQDLIEKELIKRSHASLAQEYIRYRYKKELLRQSNTTDNSIRTLLEGENDYWKKENSNKNSKLITTQRDYIAGITSTDISRRFIIPKDVLKAHDKGAIHVHDIDYLAENARNNCCLVNLEDMLQNGTVINETMIERPHRFLTACTVATQILTAVSSSQFGGVSMTWTHLAPFVDSSRQRFIKKYKNYGLDNENAKKLAEIDVKKEIEDGVQTFTYQTNSMSTTNGQSPFLTSFMYLGETTDPQTKKDLALIIEEVLRQRIEGLKNRQGVPVTYAFPKLILCLEEDIINENGKYHYLMPLAAECSAKRLVPDYVSEKVMKKLKIDKTGNGAVYPPMGCRSFLNADEVVENVANALNFDKNKGKYYGRFNIGVTTLNLAYIALEANDIATRRGTDKKAAFRKTLNKYAELCHKMQLIRAKRLSRVKADVAPVLWMDGALARLNATDTLERLVYSGYATSSLGYAGLYEAVKIITGKDHWTDGYDYGLEVMNLLNEYTNKWKKEDKIAHSLYGTPLESTTFKFAKACRRDFGDDVFEKLDGHDRFYITNSIHIPVFAEVNPFEKLSIEATLQPLSPGGNINYIETADMTKNLEAVMQVMKHIYETSMYAEINTETSYCHKCHASGSIHLVGEGLNIRYKCQYCGNTDREKMNYAVRVCGYISTHEFNEGRTGDIKDRYKHLDTHEAK